MVINVAETIRITDPSKQVQGYVEGQLIIPNPDYAKKQRLGFSTYKTPKVLYLYSIDGDTVELPYGCLRDVLPLIKGHEFHHEFKSYELLDFGGTIPLYDYQEAAVKYAVDKVYGIIQAPAGSGKTQMGLAVAQKLKGKTLWITHTKDLLNQSKERAEKYFDKSKLGVISEGKIAIGETITFATVQTLCKIDLDRYRNEWQTIIVDECHRVAGTPTAMTQFSKVLNSLSAMHKYGLSATVHRADGLIRATYALLGKVIYEVPETEVADKVMKVTIQPVDTNCYLCEDMLNPDGTINWSRMVTILSRDRERNNIILNHLKANKEHYNLVLSDRLEQLEYLYNSLPDELKGKASFINGKMTSKGAKEERNQAIEDMRQGKKHFLFASYNLAKEGLDIPRLDRLYLVTPQKDYAIIVQSIGRVARTFEGKEDPIVYDYVDGLRHLQNCYKKRCTTYRKCRATIRGFI